MSTVIARTTADKRKRRERSGYGRTDKSGPQQTAMLTIARAQRRAEQRWLTDTLDELRS